MGCAGRPPALFCRRCKVKSVHHSIPEVRDETIRYTSSFLGHVEFGADCVNDRTCSRAGEGGSVSPSNRIVLGAIGIGPRGRYVLSCMLDEPDVQFVAICDVQTDRRRQVKQMADKKHGIGDCRELADTMHRYSRVFQAGTQRRSIGNFQLAVHLARSGKLGRLKALHASIYKLRVLHDWLPAEPEPPEDVCDWKRWLGPSPWRSCNKRYVHGSWVER